RLRFSGPKTSIICSPMTSLKTSIKTITYLSDTGCLEIQGASLTSVIPVQYRSALFQRQHTSGRSQIQHRLIQNTAGLSGKKNTNNICILIITEYKIISE
ncbi:hypothetical protein, partial [Escherichia coli]|uniref:hypothetical protein n=1 Tax=Escherichia coli TaxID=562 RepID=UPI003A511F14